MKTIEIITHCYAMKDRRYAVCLHYQLSSIVFHNPKNLVYITVLHSPDDWDVKEVLKMFTKCLIHPLIALPQDLPQLGRRSIGRNLAAKNTTADIIWFADADYYFGEGALDRLAEFNWNGSETLLYPATVQISKTHEIGDKTLEGFHPTTPDKINPDDFKPIHYSRAIGGCQIVEGDFARKYGYLDGHSKYQSPTNRPFGNKGHGTHTPDDIVYRKFCQSHGVMRTIDLPNVFRIRHSEGVPDAQVVTENVEGLAAE